MLATITLAALAQLVEHLIRNEGVGGSNPSSGTIFFPKILYVATRMSASAADQPIADSYALALKIQDMFCPLFEK